MRRFGLIGLALVLAGCAPAPSPVAPPTAAPMFASEEEALAAAEEAYAEYVALADQVFAEGGAGSERLSAVATGSFLDSTVRDFRANELAGVRSVGTTVFRNMTLQRVDPESEGAAVVTAFVCEDISALDVLDATGASIVSATRPPTSTLRVVFDFVDPYGLVISSRVAQSNEPC